jgi:signal transduction histidine kinase
VEIFDPLVSVDDLYRRSGSGSGLQLHVVRDIARAFDGDLVFEPTEGRGNTFLLKLPPLPPERTTARLYTGSMILAGSDKNERRL